LKEALVGKVLSGTFTAQENFTVEYYAGGVDQTTSQPLGDAGPFNAWTSNANIKKSSTQLESATMLMLQTRHNLGISSLSMSSQAAQALLRLF
jgi:hypothetical protein